MHYYYYYYYYHHYQFTTTIAEVAPAHLMLIVFLPMLLTSLYNRIPANALFSARLVSE